MFSFLRLLILLFFISAMIIGCDDENPNPNYPLYPIDLKVTETSNGWRYEWTKINARDFDSYWVVRTEGDTVPYLADNDVELLTPNSEVITVVVNPDSTTFHDSVSLVNKASHVRVFAFLGNRSVSSKNVAVKANSDLASMPVNATDFVYDFTGKRLVGIDRLSSKIAIFNVKNSASTLISQPKADNLPIRFTELGEVNISKTNYGNEVYIPGLNSNTVIYDIDKNIFSSANIFFAGRSVFGYKNALLIGNQNSMQCLIRSVTNVFQSTFNYSPNNFFSGSHIVLRPLPNQKELWLIKTFNTETEITVLNYLRIDTINFPKIVETNRVNFNFTFTLKPFVFSNDGSKFINTNEGILTDKNNSNSINLSKNVPSVKPSYLNFVFSADGNVIYALRNNSKSRSNNLIDVFSYPQGTYLKSIPFKIKADNFFIDNNELIIVGSVGSTLEKSFIERIQL